MIEPDDVLGESYSIDDVPMWPGRIYARESSDGISFSKGFPHAPVIVVEVRFVEAKHRIDKDFTVVEARRVDTSNPEDVFGDWQYMEKHQI